MQVKVFPLSHSERARENPAPPFDNYSPLICGYTENSEEPIFPSVSSNSRYNLA